MPPKNADTPGKKGSKSDSNPDKKAVSDEEVRQESGKAANAAIAAQKKAKELKDAAAAAGDPDERQKLTEQAMNAQIEAESFGKTAKYLRSGTFQGMAMGTGLGVAPGATLGAITGTLVGGVSSTLLGGLGAGLGGATGWLHGPFVDLGKVAGKGVKKVTGNLPGWAASEEQKRTLEKMMGQVNEEEMPDADELEKFKSEGGGGQMDEGWMKSAKGMMPDQNEMGSAIKSGTQGASDDSDKKDSKTSEIQQAQPAGEKTSQQKDSQGRKKPRKLNDKTGSGDTDTLKTKSDREASDKANSAEGQSDTQKGAQSMDARARELDQREAELDRRQAKLDEKEKALAQRDQKLKSRSGGQSSDSTERSKSRGQPRKLQSRSSESK